MARSFLRRFSRSRSDAFPEEPESEVENEFSQPRGDGRTRPRSLFSHAASSNFTDSTRSTGLTSGTGDTDLTAGTVSSGSSSSKTRPQVLDSDSLTRSHHRFISREQGSSSVAVPLPDVPENTSTQVAAPRTREELIALLQSLAVKLTAMYSEVNAASAPRIAGLIARTIQDYSRKFEASTVATEGALPDEVLCEILRIVLGLTDVMLVGAPHRSTKMHLLMSLEQFAKALRLMDDSHENFVNTNTVALPKNFALGVKGRVAPYENMLTLLLDSIAGGNVAISEEDGAYIAPVLRGLSSKFSVPTLCFGIPTFGIQQLEAIAELRSQVKYIHVYGRSDYITLASGPAAVHAPYRIPRNPRAPPMSMSIAVSDSKYVSGTLGGFLYPQNENLQDPDSSTYAITCGHVCLQPEDNTKLVNPEKYEDPRVLVPSPVLVQLYRKALIEQRDRYNPQSPQYKAYVAALAGVENHNFQQLGEVIWGERTVVQGQMSDLAVIKCSPGIQCENWLGDDVDMSQYDPGLIMHKLKVRSMISKFRGIEVFKYGSTSKYTSGVISSARIAYWSDGTLRTSEFAVRSHNTSTFANGGDSGAWILHARDDGLAVVGMLHSYDGEMREFGLYTPIQSILSRLKTVTGVSWGVLGVPSHDDVLHEKGESSD